MKKTVTLLIVFLVVGAMVVIAQPEKTIKREEMDLLTYNAIPPKLKERIPHEEVRLI